MIKIIRSLLLLTLIISHSVWADCGALRTDSYFNVVLEIKNAQLNETVIASKKNGTQAS